MIESVYIKNFALAKEVEFNFSKGFNVVVGETGAGKSIIISAILFALGNKVDKSIIRTGESIVRVNLKFVDLSEKVIEVFKDFDVVDEIYISRSYNIDGKNECKINGIPLSVTELKNISSYLLDSCLQHETVSVLKQKNQILLLDSYIGSEVFQLQNLLKAKHNNKKEIDKQLQDLGGDPTNKERTIDLLKYQISEIEQINAKPEDEIDLRENIRKLSDSEKIVDNLNNVINNFDGISGCIYQLKSSLHSLGAISSYDCKYQDIQDKIQNYLYELEDVLSEVKNETQNLYYDEKEIERLDKKLDDIKMLKKKYGPTLEDVYKYLEDAKEKLNNLENANDKILQLNKQKENCIKDIFSICSQISDIRRKYASVLENKLCTELVDLSMKDSKFKIQFNNVPTIDDFEYNELGFDNIEFMFSANKGEALKSLIKTISGGELSRFMLAFKNIFATNDSVGTLVLDEIDSGISGETGTNVAKKIATISKNIQIICISHMQQVTAMADNYIFVEKITTNNNTESVVKLLDEEEQINYIAKISSGNNLTDSAISNAKEMKLIANKYKNQIN